MQFFYRRVFIFPIVGKAEQIVNGHLIEVCQLQQAAVIDFPCIHRCRFHSCRGLILKCRFSAPVLPDLSPVPPVNLSGVPVRNAGFHRYIAPSCGWLPPSIPLYHTCSAIVEFSISGRFSYFVDIREKAQKCAIMGLVHRWIIPIE